MDFCYKDYFNAAPNTGYETLSYDCMIGDATLFQRADNIEAGWQVVQPILDAWANCPPRSFRTMWLAEAALPRLTSYWPATVERGDR